MVLGKLARIQNEKLMKIRQMNENMQDQIERFKAGNK